MSSKFDVKEKVGMCSRVESDLAGAVETNAK